MVSEDGPMPQPWLRLPEVQEARRRTSENAVARAEELLRAYLTPGQLEDWTKNHAFNVRGSMGGLFRLTPAWSGQHRSVVQKGGLGISVWPVGLAIDADWALALLLYFKLDEYTVLTTGCHARVHGVTVTDYEGEL